MDAPPGASGLKVVEITFHCPASEIYRLLGRFIDTQGALFFSSAIAASCA
jgi:hypothetical protein